MHLQEQVYSILLVSSAESFSHSLLELLPEGRYEPVHTAASISSAKQKVLERAYDFIIINTPLPDDAGLHFAIDICASGNAVALLFVRNEIYEEAHSRLVQHGVFTLSKPTSRSTITTALKWMESARERLRRFEKKTLSIEEKMEEIRLINRAKWLLIEKENMTEPEAHRYIEKQAMDHCVSRKTIAQQLIETYQNRTK